MALFYTIPVAIVALRHEMISVGQGDFFILYGVASTIWRGFHITYRAKRLSLSFEKRLILDSFSKI